MSFHPLDLSIEFDSSPAYLDTKYIPDETLNDNEQTVKLSLDVDAASVMTARESEDCIHKFRESASVAENALKERGDPKN